MRRITWLTAIVMSTIFILAGCGEKSEVNIVKDLERAIQDMNSYSAEGSMILHTGEQPQEYALSVWFQKPEFYRIAITNKQKNVTQIVLKNEEGVFVLTPHLQKSFRFRSEWPNDQGQIYLYQTLLRSIIEDSERAMTKDGDSYVFEVKANYQNSALPRQKIWLKRDGYAPLHVELLDVNDRPIVTVDFSSFERDRKFEADSFDMDRNLTSWHLQTLPTLSPLPSSDDLADEVMAQLDSDFGVIYPAYEPEGVWLTNVQELQLGETNAVVLRYVGERYSYTILESRPRDAAVFVHETTLLDLGFTMGILTGDEQKTLIWLDDGVEYRMTSNNLPEEEMIKIAQSVQGQVGK